MIRDCSKELRRLPARELLPGHGLGPEVRNGASQALSPLIGLVVALLLVVVGATERLQAARPLPAPADVRLGLLDVLALLVPGPSLGQPVPKPGPAVDGSGGPGWAPAGWGLIMQRLHASSCDPARNASASRNASPGRLPPGPCTGEADDLGWEPGPPPASCLRPVVRLSVSCLRPIGLETLHASCLQRGP
jgi:hypothetical protein